MSDQKSVEFKEGDIVMLKRGSRRVSIVAALIRDEDLDGVYLEHELRGARFWPRAKVKRAA